MPNLYIVQESNKAKGQKRRLMQQQRRRLASDQAVVRRKSAAVASAIFSRDPGATYGLCALQFDPSVAEAMSRPHRAALVAKV